MPAWWVPEGTEGMLPGGPLCRPAVRLRTGTKILHRPRCSRVWKRESALEEAAPSHHGADRPRGGPGTPLGVHPLGPSFPLVGEKVDLFPSRRTCTGDVLPRDARWQRSPGGSGGLPPPQSEASSKGQQMSCGPGHESGSNLRELETPGCSPSPASR